MITIDLADKIALVLGGSRGIGASITKTLAAAGAVTFFTHTGNPKYQDRVDSLLSDVRGKGYKVQGLVSDATNSKQTTELVGKIIDEEGKIDILVCNVGQNFARPAEEVSDAEWQRFIDINLSSAFYGIRAVLAHMVKAKYGRIIIIGSSTAYNGGGGAIDYAAAKTGLQGMMLYLAKYYTRKGILTNVIHPCVIETDLLRERYADKEKRKALIAQVPVGRLGKPDDIAGLTAYLSSSWGDFICGQSILVDGGRTLFG